MALFSRLPQALCAGVLMCAALPLRAEIYNPAAPLWVSSGVDALQFGPSFRASTIPQSFQGLQLAQNQVNSTPARSLGAPNADAATEMPPAAMEPSSPEPAGDAAEGIQNAEPAPDANATGGPASNAVSEAPSSASEIRVTAASRNGDPFEGFNRKMFSFNRGLDRIIIKPVATAYVAVIPAPVRSCVSNIFGNLADIWTTVNDVLQAKGRIAINDGGRVLMNTTFGLLGCFDLATRAGVEKHKEDFGQTLGRWGVGEGPYLVLPILGPSTVRDTAALPADAYGDVVQHVDHVRTYNQLSVLRVVDLRSQLLDATDMVDAAALDAYSFTRDAYLQRRRSQVDDGERNADDLPDYGGNLSQATESSDAALTGGVPAAITPADDPDAPADAPSENDSVTH